MQTANINTMNNLKYMLFCWEYNTVEKDLTELTNEEFEELANKDGGWIFDTTEDFVAAFNAEMFSVHTHQLRVVNEYSKVKNW